MKKLLCCLVLTLSLGTGLVHANAIGDIISTEVNVPGDSLRLVELDRYWAELSRTVREGDFEGYAAAYHPDAVVIFATGENKTSVPISTALANWKQGFLDTKAGKQGGEVAFRFSQRIGDPTTAHETGIFQYRSTDADGQTIGEYRVHFEMLMVKQNGNWYGLMEYQKSAATEEEWMTLQP